MFKIFFLSLLITQMMTAPCEKGCLRCQSLSQINPVKVCTLCDTQNNYYFKDNACVISDQVNCQFLMHSGECALCKGNYKIDSTTKKCVAIETANLKANCLYYDPSGNCIVCAPKYFVTNNACSAVTNQIANCNVYLTAELCGDCDDGYDVSLDQKTCKQMPNDCLAYSKFECKTCQGGFIKNKNLYQKYQVFDNNTSRDIITTLILQNKIGRSIREDLNVCELGKDINCLELETFEKCKVCDSGYYLTVDKLCRKFPDEVIPNCLLYTSLTNCNTCNPGFYRKDSVTCEQVTLSVPNCSQYAGNSNTQTCVACSTNYYLQSSTNCQLRTKTFDQCKFYKFDEEKCAQCNDGWILAQTKDLCLKVKENCLTHELFNSPKNQEDLLCTQCVNGYYKTDGGKVCVLGTQQNCEVYQVDQNVCAKCNNQYYPVPNCNLKHPDITNCTEYSADYNHICVNCSNKFTPLQYLNKCVDQGLINNCASYNFDTLTLTCDFCDTGYYLQSSTQCTQIDLSKNCIQASNFEGICGQCKDEYGLAVPAFNNQSAVQCVGTHNYLKSKCAKMIYFEQLYNQECDICQSNTFPINAENEFVCIENSKLQFINTQSIAIVSDVNCTGIWNDGDCVICKAGFFVDFNYKSCVSNKCKGNGTTPKPFNAMTLLEDPNDSNIVTIDDVNFCIEVANAELDLNNLVKGPDIKSPYEQLTLSCHTFITEVKFSEFLYSNINPFNDPTTGWVNDSLDIWYQVYCPKFDPQGSASYNSVAQTTSAPNLTISDGRSRHLYYQINNDDFIRINCGWRYTGKITDQGYLNCAQNQDASFSDVYYYNLFSNVSKLFTVHKCNDVNSIPVIAFDSDIATTFGFLSMTNYTLQTTDWYTDVTANNSANNIFCLNNSTIANIRTGLGLDADIPDGQINTLSNCALGHIRTGLSKTLFNNTSYNLNTVIVITVGSENTSLVCLACKPGYKGTTKGTNGIFLIQSACTVIDNCDINSVDNLAVNTCRKCIANYIHEYDGISYLWDSCVKIPILLTNCQFYQKSQTYNGTTDLTGTCKVCSKGYNLNQDNYCEIIKPDNCTNYLARDPSSVNYLLTKFNTFRYNDSFGCTKCGDDSKSVHRLVNNLAFPNVYCANTDFITTNKTVFDHQTNGDASNYADNCLNWNTSKFCVICRQNYILTTENNKCILQTDIPNCEVAFNSTTCTKCRAGSGLTSNGCVIGQIADCQNYNIDYLNNSDTSKATCALCKDGYWFDTNNYICKKGIVANCKVYEDGFENKCNECQSGYWVTVITNNQEGSRYCLPIQQTLGCKTVKFSNATGNLQVECDTCSNLQAKIVEINSLSDVVSSSCHNFNEIANCKTYNNSQIILNGYSLTCALCEDNYYLSDSGVGYLCVERQIRPVNCSTYYPNKDRCSECNNNTFLTPNEDDCYPYPVGIYGCEQFSNEITCTKCRPNFFLANNKCEFILTADRIANCQYYTNKTTCLSCDSSYILDTNTCALEVVSNCLEFQTKDSCKTCNSGYAFKVVDGKNTCELFTISNCVLLDQTTRKCLQCDTTYYIDSNGDKCTKANPVILNCLIMKDSLTCDLCDNTTALTSDGKLCVNKEGYDANCEVTIVPANYTCSICKPGYIFASDVCSNSLTATTAGCFSINAEDKTCSYCNTNYYMNEAGSCISNNPEPPKPSGIGILNVIGMIVAFLFF